jgi:type I restriction enzyme M protein
MIEPFKGRVYDPCCGSSGMFVQSEAFIREHGGKLGDIAIYGQESNPTTWRLAKMNLAIRGIDAKLGPEHADSFHRDLHKDLKADFVMANPPFNMSDWGGERLRDDVRWKYGAPPAGNANFAWVQHIIHHLAPNGVAGFVLANGSMSSNTSGEGEIRRRIIEADLVDCMVALPAQLFYATQIPACLWFLARNKRDPRLRDRRGEKGAGEYKDVAGFCKSATTEEIAGHGYVLTPGRYVGAEAVENDGEPFDEKMRRLVSTLAGQIAEGRKLEEDIRKKLRGLGYDI